MDVADALDDPACRLLTIVGPGGVGKTRLAVQAAAQKEADFSNGIFFVDLQPVEAAVRGPAVTESVEDGTEFLSASG